MADGLLQLMPAQWRLCRIQLINWGTFDGYTDLPIRASDDRGNASVVCITGKSGTGKSTLFDAGTVLMMPYGRTLNAASNLGRGGSPRQVRTYLKGMVDTVADERGRARGKYLRDDSAPIWSAIVHTWEDSSGALFSAARFFQLKPGSDDIDHTFITSPSHLDPRALRPYATTRLRMRDVRAVYPECTWHDGSGRFFKAIYQTLGIGENGNGTNAMKLLYRIQSGIPMTNVDDLFKELVLDPPSTFDLAQQAIDCYDQNQDVWHRIDEAKRKRGMLEGIDESHAGMLEAAEGAHLVESLAHESKEGGFRLWMERHRLALAEAEHKSKERRAARLANDLAAREQSRSNAQSELTQIQQSIFERGGGELERKKAQLEQDRVTQGKVRQLRSQLAKDLRETEQEFPESSDAWDELVIWADDVLGSAEQRRREIQEQIDELGVELRGADERAQRCQSDLDYYRSHRTRIPQHMSLARDRMAQAVGLDPADIPFAAELMDVPREQELWRTAVNISLAHVSDRILVDARLEAKFRKGIDGLANQLGRRYHFDFVDLDEEFERAPKPGHVSSKVVYRDDSPFAPYVRKLVCDSTDHLCVDTVSQLSGKGPRIVASGQERVGNRGAIGHSRNTLIIGFTNEMLIEDCEAELEDAKAALRKLNQRRQALQRQRSRLEGEQLLARSIGALRWEDVDLAGIEARIAQTVADIERIEQDDELKALEGMLERVRREWEDAVAACNGIERDLLALKKLTDQLEMLLAQGRQFVAGLEGLGIHVTEAQAQLCEAAVAQAEQTLGDREAVVRSFDRVDEQAHRYLSQLLSSRLAKQASCEKALETSFANYHATFMPEDAEHGTGIDEYPYYHAVLADLVQQKLDDPEEEWEAEMLRDVARHLSLLQDAFVTEERALGERLRPVNQILGQFTFGERGGHLSVVSERRPMADVTRFRRELRRLTALATTYDFDDSRQVQREHRSLDRFVDTLRKDLASTGKSARHFLDTRHTVHVTALETPPSAELGEPVIYDSINGKSGGQYQELVAFILGAALLYCLGYNLATLPSYAPVYLDEAFIKADSEHTRRALSALSGLGFQVVIAVPDGKVEAVAPLASQIISLSKDERTNVTHAKMLRRVAAGGEGAEAWRG